MIVAIVAVLIGVLPATPAAASGTGVLSVSVTPVDSVSGAQIASVAFGQHQDHVAYRVTVSCSVADCVNAQVAFSPSQPDPYGLAAKLPATAAGNTLLMYDTWTAPSGAGTPTGTDATGKVFPLGTLTAGSGLSFTTSYSIAAAIPQASVKPAEYYPDGFQILMSATASSSSAVGPVSATAAPVTWSNQVPTPTAGVWPPAGNVPANTSISVPVSMSSGATGPATDGGPTWDGTSRTVAAGSYTVIMTLPSQAVPGAMPDGGVYDATAHTITWTRGSTASPDYTAAGGWGLNAPGGWYGSDPATYPYYPHIVPLTFPGSAFSPTGCDFTQTVPISVSATLTYLDPARTTQTATNSGNITVSCTSPFPGSDAGKHSFLSSGGYSDGSNVVVPQPGNQVVGDYFWQVNAFNESNVAGVATIVDNQLDQADAPVYNIGASVAGVAVNATFNWTLDDGTTGTTSGVSQIVAPAGRHYTAATITSGSIAPGRVKSTDTSNTQFSANFHYLVTSSAPVGQTRTNTATVTMAWPSQSTDPAFAPQTKDVTGTITFVASKSTITSTFPAAPQVSGGGQALPGRDVTFSVAGRASNVSTSSTFTPEYVFIAPAGWTIDSGSASFPATAPSGVHFAYATKTVGGVQRQVVVATWPVGTTFSSLNPLPTMTVVAQPTYAVPSGTTSVATAWMGDSARNWNNAQANWTNPVQNTPDVDGTGDTTAWFSSASQSIQVSSFDSLAVQKQICLPDPLFPGGCNWIATPGATVPVNVHSTNIQYRVIIQNTGNTQLSNIVAYDVLPYVGDTGLIPATASTPRGSGFNETLSAVSNVASNLTLSYSGSTNPTRPEVSPAGTTNDWGPGPSGKQAIRAAVNGTLAPGATASFEYSAAVAANATQDSKACNSVAISSASTPASEPLPVCAQLKTNPAIGLTKTVDTSALSSPPKAGDLLTYTLTATNTGDVTLTGVTVSDALAGLSTISYNWPGTAGTLTPGQVVTGTATYHLTQGDIDAGDVSNAATASATAPSGETVTSPANRDVPLTRTASIVLSKTANPTSIVRAGDTVTYTVTATNTGNETLSAVTVTDPLPGLTVQSTTWPGAAGILAPGQAVTVEATYTATQHDIDTGLINNTATVTSTAPDGTTPSDSKSKPVTAAANALLTIVKSADPSDAARYTLGRQITYSFVVTNAGNVTLTSPQVEETAFDGSPALTVDCSSLPSSLAPGQQGLCQATYTLTQADIDRGSTSNTATATATDPHGTLVTADPSTTVIPGAANPSMSFSKIASPTTVTAVGQTVTYTFEATNTGDVTLSGVTISDPHPALSALSYTWPGAPEKLLPGQTVTAQATYTVTPADMDAGKIENTATVVGTDPHGTLVRQSKSATVQVARLTLVKAADASALSSMPKAGDVLTYRFTLTNTGSVTITGATIADPHTGLSPLTYAWPAQTGELAPGQAATATATYRITQADIDAGQVANTADASGTAPGGTPVEASSQTDVTLQHSAALTLVKSADPIDIAHFTAGQQVTYSFVVTNSGNVTLGGIGIDETAFTGHGGTPTVTCPPNTTLAPTEQVTCAATYTLTSDDIAAGRVSNTAVAHATEPTDVTSEHSTVAFPGDTHPALSLVKTADKRTVTAAGQSVAYAFLVTNTGDIVIHDVHIVDATFTGAGTLSQISCPNDVNVLLPGQTVTCTASYLTTDNDMHASTIQNTATATGTSPAGDPVTSPSSTATTTVSVDTPSALPPTGSDMAGSVAAALAGLAALVGGFAALVVSRRRSRMRARQ